MDQDWPAQSSELWPIEKITPYARNSRTHSDEQVAQIAASIREWGWTTYTGYSTTGSSCGYLLGGASPTTYKSVAIKGIWSVNAGSTSFDFAGNQTGNASFLTSVTINGTNIGAVPAVLGARRPA